MRSSPQNFSEEKILAALVGVPAKVRLLRLFFRNPSRRFSLKVMGEKTHLPRYRMLHTLKDFERIALIRKTRSGWALNRSFIFAAELAALATRTIPVPRAYLVREIARMGRPKLIVIGGTFLNSDKKRVDLLVAGEKIREGRFAKLVNAIEAEAGTELLWAAMPTQEFLYRYKMFDRFVRDIFEYPHEILLNKLPLKL